MLESSGSPTGPSNAESASLTQVVAFVLAVEGVPLTETVLALEAQVYDLAAIVVIGGDERMVNAAGALGVDHAPAVRDAVDRLDQTLDYVWFVHGDATPRPDALGALVYELERNDASMVGSKVLDAAHPDRLESVGAATDVFGEPYTGLDPDEVDLEQYDVVRDVSFVSGVSVLIRRDLLRGLRAIDPAMPPVAAGMDLSQRARIAGGRVMVVPSSEVLHSRACGHDVAGWRELAGRMRAMWKAYRLITLLWVVPVGTLLGLLDGVARLVLGSVRPLSDFVRAIVWNLGHLPSTISARAQLRRVRQSRDEELFRYQVSGSLRLRQLVNDVGERFGWVIDEEEGIVAEDELVDDVTAAGPILAGITLVVLGLASRSLWFGRIPAVGFSLPNHADLGSVLESWAGGWNPAGMGSSEPTHPSVALSAAAEWVMGGWSGARSVLTVVLMVLGALALGRLLRRLGVEGPSRHLAGIVLFLGAAAATVAESTDWSALLAFGPAVWLLELIIRPTQPNRRSQVGLGAAVVVAASATAMASPMLPVGVVVSALVAWFVLDRVGWQVLIRSLIALTAAAIAIGPYLFYVAPAAVFDRGPVVEVDPTSVGWMILAVAALLGTIVAPGGRWRVIVWGSVMAAAPVLTAVTLDWRGDAAVAALGLAAIGSAIVVGGALGFDDRAARSIVVLRGLGVASAFAVILVSLGPVLGGRAGLPEDEWTGRLNFVSSLEEAGGPPRVLLLGEPGSLPGDERDTDLHAYRVITGDVPTIDQARLPQPRPSEEALEAAVDRIINGGVVRPGELLAPFAIRWLVVIGDLPITDNLVTQIDLVPIPVAEGIEVFRNDAYRPRAVVSDGSEWVAGRTNATGPPSDATVRWADSASGRWGPSWSQSDWFNLLSASEGQISFDPEPARRTAASVAVGVILLSGVVAIWGRERR